MGTHLGVLPGRKVVLSWGSEALWGVKSVPMQTAHYPSLPVSLPVSPPAPIAHPMSSLCTPSQSLGSPEGMSQVWGQGNVSAMGHNQLHAQAGEPCPRWDLPTTARQPLPGLEIVLGSNSGLDGLRGAGVGGTPQLRQLEIPPQEYMASTPDHQPGHPFPLLAAGRVPD